MVEHRPWLTFLTHAVLILGCLVIAFPIYVTFVASTHTLDAIAGSFPFLPGRHLIDNYYQAITVGSGEVGATVGASVAGTAQAPSSRVIVVIRIRLRDMATPSLPAVDTPGSSSHSIANL